MLKTFVPVLRFSADFPAVLFRFFMGQERGTEGAVFHLLSGSSAMLKLWKSPAAPAFMRVSVTFCLLKTCGKPVDNRWKAHALYAENLPEAFLSVLRFPAASLAVFSGFSRTGNGLGRRRFPSPFGIVRHVETVEKSRCPCSHAGFRDFLSVENRWKTG